MMGLGRDCRQLAILLALSVAMVAHAAASDRHPKILLGELARQLDATYESYYQNAIEVDETTRVYKYDCSGLIDYSIERVMPEVYDHFDKVLGTPGSTRLTTEELITFFRSIDPVTDPHWTRVESLAETKPGDILVFRYENGTRGHAVIVKRNLGYAPDSAETEVLLEIYDSALSRHSNDSTRHHGEVLSRADPGGGGTGLQGLGFGTMGFTTNKTQYRWRGAEPASSSLKDMQVLLIGRLKDGTLPAVPPAPKSFSVTAGKALMKVDWATASGAASYDLKRAAVSGGPYEPVQKGLAVTAFTDTAATGLAHDKTYYYTVTAVNAGGEAQSVEDSAKFSAIPAEPANLVASPGAEGSKSVTLNWEPSFAAATYKLYRATKSGGTFTLTKSGLVAPPFVNTGLTAGKAYFYKLKAVNAAGTSEYSNEAAVVAPAAIPIPPPPAGLSANSGAAKSITLTWAPTPGAATYKVYRATTATGTYTSQKTGLAVTTFTQTTLTSGKTYFYKVKAVNASGTGAYSEMASATAK